MVIKIIVVVTCLMLLIGILENHTRQRPKYSIGQHLRRAYVTEESGLRFHGNVIKMRCVFSDEALGREWQYYIIAPDGKEGWWPEWKMEHDDRFDPKIYYERMDF